MGAKNATGGCTVSEGAQKSAEFREVAPGGEAPAGGADLSKSGHRSAQASKSQQKPVELCFAMFCHVQLSITFNIG